MWVIKRPGVDNFLKQMGEIYEIVVFTASPSDVSQSYHIFISYSSSCFDSMLILYWICLMLIMLSPTDCSVTVVTTLVGAIIMSRSGTCQAKFFMTLSD